MTGRLARIAAALAVPLLLTSCFLTPGAFNSTLDLRSDGSFAFAYKGEMVFQSPDEMFKGVGGEDGVWKDDKAVCYKTGDSDSTDSAADAMSNAAAASSAAAEASADAAMMDNAAADSATSDNAMDVATATDDGTRPCTAKEIAEQKKDWETERTAKAEKSKKDAAQFGAIFGFTPGDDTANKKLAATIMKYEGWKSVVYKGNGVFDVDYAITGGSNQDFLFPLLPQSDIIFPFVTLRRQADGSVRVNAPSLIGGGLRALASRMKALGAAAADTKDIPVSTRTKGSFTVTTDGEVLTNNTENGPAKVANGRTLVWEIGPDTEKVPEALIRLK